MTLPIPLDLRLPGPEWKVAAPGSLGLTNAAMAAVRPGSGSYTPLITVSGGMRRASDTVHAIADESLAVLAEQTEEASLVRRTDYGSDHSPGVTQLLAATATIDGQAYDLRQLQMVQCTPDLSDPTQQAVLIFTCTCTADQLPVVAPEFEAFMASVRPSAPAPGSTPPSEPSHGEGDA